MPSVTLFQAFEILYTRFLLRDFVGKVIPGLIFLFICLLGVEDIECVKAQWRELTPTEIFAIVAFAWIFTLCSQSVHSRVMPFYFPVEGDDSIKYLFENLNKLFRPCHWRENFLERERLYAEEVVKVYDFFKTCTPDEKAQYERFVVVKEACANSFFCTMLAIFPFLISKMIIFLDGNESLYLSAQTFIKTHAASLVAVSFWILSAYLMKIDNLHRQNAFLSGVKDRREKKIKSIFESSDDEHQKELYKLILNKIS